MREIGIGVAIALVLGIVFTASLLSRERSAHDATREALAVQRGQVSACATSLEAVNAATAEELAEAQRWAKAGQEAAQAALQDAREAAEREDAARQALQAAKREPTCAEQLEVRLCASIPLL